MGEQQNKSFSSENRPKKKKWITVVIFFIIILAIGSLIATEGVQWWKEKQYWVKLGFASDKFPFKMLSERELVEKGLWAVESPELINTTTRVRPEETYAKFRQALIDGNMDLASECFIKEQQEEWKKSLFEIKEKGLLGEMINDLPKKLEDTYIYTDEIIGKDTRGRDLDHVAMDSHEYIVAKDGKNYSHTISFNKNWDGIWLIEKL